MNYLIVGLGNVGAEYAHTRHNIGFDVADYLAEKHNVSFKLERLAYKTVCKMRGRNVHIIKPTTYMNLSGKALRYWMQMTKTSQNNVLVIVDDKDLPFTKLRIRPKGGDGGHNGLANITQILGNNKYARLRFGIGNNFHPGQQVKYVLGKWTVEEEQALPKAIDTCASIIQSFVSIGLPRTMNMYNKK